MDDLWKRFSGEDLFGRRFKEEWLPTVDISENKDGCIIKADLPDMEEKDVEVSISESVLTIKGGVEK